MKRVTPEMVIEAYNKTGLKPIQEEWYAEGFDNLCKACGLGAVAIARGAERDTSSIIAFVEQNMVETPYMEGFIHGFDNGSPLDWRKRNGKWAQGYEDGKAAYERLVSLGDFEGGEN